MTLCTSYRVPDIRLINNIIAVKDRIRFVAADPLCGLPWHTCPIHVPHCRSAKVMEEAFDGCSRFRTRRPLGFVKGLDRMTASRSGIPTSLQRSVKDQGRILASDKPSTLNNRCQLTI